MITILTDEVLQANLCVQTVVDYVLAHDWQPKSHPNENIRVFVGPLDDEGNPIPLILPTDDSFSDKDLRLTEAVYLLADIEARSPFDIIAAIITHTQEKQSLTRQVP
ncbi:MAG: hypothetical protein F6K30_14745 [Cyanothece sp. SIO2G6]|nr:hypothetical protein [Cyanothece sp. SIO2G6]